MRALSRQQRDSEAGVEATTGDVLDRASLDAAFRGVDQAYYLVHGLADTADLEDVELEGACAYAAAAEEAGVERVVYLGGPARGDELSPHLRTGHEVGEVLRREGPPAIEFQASVVIGDGSASFELVRTLVDSAPALVLPDWIETQCQPIAVDDVVAYLADALEIDLPESRVFETGAALAAGAGAVTGPAAPGGRHAVRVDGPRPQRGRDVRHRATWRARGDRAGSRRG